MPGFGNSGQLGGFGSSSALSNLGNSSTSKAGQLGNLLGGPGDRPGDRPGLMSSGLNQNPLIPQFNSNNLSQGNFTLLIVYIFLNDLLQ